MALGGMDQLVGADWVTPYPSHSGISHLFLSTGKDASVFPCQKQNIVEDLCLHPPTAYLLSSHCWKTPWKSSLSPVCFLHLFLFTWSCTTILGLYSKRTSFNSPSVAASSHFISTGLFCRTRQVSENSLVSRFSGPAAPALTRPVHFPLMVPILLHLAISWGSRVLLFPQCTAFLSTGFHSYHTCAWQLCAEKASVSTPLLDLHACFSLYTNISTSVCRTLFLTSLNSVRRCDRGPPVGQTLSQTERRRSRQNSLSLWQVVWRK